MENYLMLLFGILVSCLVYSIIVFQFMEDRYKRVYDNKIYFIVMKGFVTICIVLINMLEMPILNLLGWIFVFGIIVIFFYADYEKKSAQRVFEIVVLLLVLTACETVGYLMLEFVFWKIGIDNIQPAMMQCLNMTFSKLIILILYYLVITKVWRKSKQNKSTKEQNMVHVVIIVYSVVNLAVIIIVVSSEMTVTFAERLLLLVNMFCIVFADFYFLYFTKFVQENSELKLKLKLFEQQSILQYEYYASQEGKYNEAVKILHDVNKHLKMIEEIYEYNETGKAREYAKKIEKMLKPLVLKEYTNNPILNILLNDKKKNAALQNTQFDLEIGNIELNFMEPVEITTVFGNLLDNAMEACEKSANKKINMKLDTYNDFVFIQISNTTNGQTKWNDGRPISQKGDNHGIGLINVENIIKKYNGSMILEEKNFVFKCSIIFND